MNDQEIEIKNLHALMNGLKESMDSLTSEVKLMKNALIGNEYGDLGIVNRQVQAESEIIELKKEIERLKNFRTQVVSYAVGVGAGAGAVTSFLFKIIGS